MRANGYGSHIQVVSEYLSFFFIMVTSTAVFYLFMMLGVGKKEIVPELASSGVSDILIMIIKFIPAIALVAAFQYLLYQLCESVISGVLVQFISAVILGYLSGCFYPISFFPKIYSYSVYSSGSPCMTFIIG
jgi:ABC-2 type transport system permease protein